MNTSDAIVPACIGAATWSTDSDKVKVGAVNSHGTLACTLIELVATQPHHVTERPVTGQLRGTMTSRWRSRILFAPVAACIVAPSAARAQAQKPPTRPAESNGWLFAKRRRIEPCCRRYLHL